MNAHFILLLVSIVFLVAVGTWCVVWPENIATNSRKRYTSSNKFFQNYPFSNMVLKTWFPTYLRCTGVVLWVFALLLLLASIFFLK
jgi:hypothetical protein